MAMIVAPREGQSRFQCCLELVALAGDYRQVQRLADGTFRVPNETARQFRLRT